jgi:hypothetical protein
MHFKPLNFYLRSDKDVAPFKNPRLLRTLKAIKNLATKKIPNIFVLVLLFTLTSCDNDEPNDDSALVKSGILGRWELQSRSFDGITPLIREVGFFLTLTEDTNRGDLSGEFTAISPGSETDGVFELNPMNGTIRFEFGDRTLTYEYDIQNNTLVFDFKEDGSNINEIWVRADLIP